MATLQDKELTSQSIIQESTDANSEAASTAPPSVQGIDPNTLKRGHFDFGKTLGEGSYARVVHARLNSVESPEFAVKIMEKAHIKKEDKIASVMMEKRILSEVDHPFIIKLFYTFQDKEYLYMCMNLVPGGELLGLINRSVREKEAVGSSDRGCDIATTRFYIAELIEALEYLHSRDIVHLDIKPENIMIAADGHIKLGDFGTAVMGMDEEALKNIFVGTAEYVSPELLKEDEAIGKSCDLWAVGCIVFQMLSGRTPFHALTEYLIFEAINTYCDGTRALEFPDSVQGASKELVEALLQRVPDCRLGAGSPGSGYDYNALKSHVFFEGVSWGSLDSTLAPFIPDPPTFSQVENYWTSGDDPNWILHGDGTLIDEDFKPSELPHHSQSNSPREGGEVGDEAGDRSVSSVRDKWWYKFMKPGENKIFIGLVEKRVGLFSKRRQLILTDTPRLVYVDPKTLEEKGEIPWTKLHGVTCVEINGSQFDVHCQKSGRSYHFKDIEGVGARRWIEIIEAMVEKQLEEP